MISIENKYPEYRSNSTLVFSCRYHVIFCPKYRRNVLTNKISIRLKEIFSEISEEISCPILEMEILTDHVHLLIDCDPSFGITKAIRTLKGKSANIIRNEFPELKKRLPCLWTRTSFIATVGSVSLETVKKYIQNQKGK